MINKFKMGKHFDTAITPTTFTLTRRATQIAAEAALDGIYVIRTSVTGDTLNSTDVVTAYKNLKHVERDFRSIKADDLDLRPIHHYLSERVRAHVLICMLACYLTWHLRHALAALTYTDQAPPARDNPVAPATRSTSATRKAGQHHDETGAPLHSFRGLLEHMATLTRNTITLGHTSIDKITIPTPTQRRAFELIDAPIPLTLK
ncbi:MAG: IS1634 family transposase [Pseudonocardiaceae bacterium]